jgi:hypothetical protein
MSVGGDVESGAVVDGSVGSGVVIVVVSLDEEEMSGAVTSVTEGVAGSGVVVGGVVEVSVESGVTTEVSVESGDVVGGVVGSGTTTGVSVGVGVVGEVETSVGSIGVAGVMVVSVVVVVTSVEEGVVSDTTTGVSVESAGVLSSARVLKGAMANKKKAIKNIPAIREIRNDICTAIITIKPILL